MKLTKSHEEKLYENVELIIGYIRSLQPYILEDVKIEWGEGFEYRLIVDKMSIHAMLKGQEVQLDRGNPNYRLYWNDDPFYEGPIDVRQCPEYAISLVTNWRSVKQKLIDATDGRGQIITAIENFQI